MSTRIMERAARCRLPGSDRIITLRASRLREVVHLGPAEMGIWDPKEEYWGDRVEPIEEWAEPIIAHGPRPMFEMQLVMPGEPSDDPFNDPIDRSNDLKCTGERTEAKKILMDLYPGRPALSRCPFASG